MSSEKTEPEFIIEFINETDVEVEYSFKNVTFTTFQDCIRFVKKENTLIKPEISEYLTVTVGKTRFTIDKGEITQFCKNSGKSLKGLTHKTEKKETLGRIYNRVYNLNAKKETEPTDIDAEKEIKKHKFLRFIRRYTYKVDKFKIEFSIIKQSRGNVDKFEDSDLFEQPEHYEIEIELDNKYNAPDLFDPYKYKNEFIKCISKYPYSMTNTMETTIKQQYSEFINKKVSGGKSINDKVTRYLFKNDRDYFLNPKPVSMSLSDINVINSNKDNYSLTDKADGESRLMYINSNNQIYLIDNVLNIYDTKLECSEDKYKNSLFNGELVYYDDKWIYAIFDVYYKGDINATNKSLDDRYKLIKELKGKIVNRVREDSYINIIYKKFYMREYEDDLDSTAIKFRDIIDNNESILPIEEEQILYPASDKPELSYKIDGMIYTMTGRVGVNNLNNDDYDKKSNQMYKRLAFLDVNDEEKFRDNIYPISLLRSTWHTNLKWKPSHENTIDFLLNEVKEEYTMMGETKYRSKIYRGASTQETGSIPIRYKKYRLYCGSDKQFIPFKPRDPFMENSDMADISLNRTNKAVCLDGSIIEDNTIVEFSFNVDKQTWVPNRVRYDKSRSYMEQYTSRKRLYDDYIQFKRNPPNPIPRPFLANFANNNREFKGPTKAEIKRIKDFKDFDNKYGDYFISESNIRGIQIEGGPNYITTCESIWKTFFKPISVDMILSGEKQDISSEPDQGYWGKGGRDRNSDPMKPLRVYNNRVKRDLLLTTTKRVETDDIRLLDISCGRGGDIFKYNDISRIDKVVGCDIDSEAILEAERRFNQLKQGSNKKVKYTYSEETDATLKILDKANNEGKVFEIIKITIQEYIDLNWNKDNVFLQHYENMSLHEFISNSIKPYIGKIKNESNIIGEGMHIAGIVIKELNVYIQNNLKDKNNLDCKFFVLDGTNDFTDIIHHVNPKKYDEWTTATADKFDIIVCNFAFHYFLETEIKCRQAMTNIINNLSQDGRFICTILDGKEIFNKLTDKLYISGFKDGVEIWKIRKEYNLTELPETFGNRIDVTLSSTGQTHIEYLFNIEHIIKLFDEMGLECESLLKFSDYYRSTDRLSPEEKEYSFLSKALIFKKKDMVKLNILETLYITIKEDKLFKKDINREELTRLIKRHVKKTELCDDLSKEKCEAIINEICVKILSENNSSVDIMANSLFQSSKILNIDNTIRDRFIELIKQDKTGYQELLKCFSSDKKCSSVTIGKLIKQYYGENSRTIIEFYNKHTKLLKKKIVENRLFIDELLIPYEITTGK